MPHSYFYGQIVRGKLTHHEARNNVDEEVVDDDLPHPHGTRKGLHTGSPRIASRQRRKKYAINMVKDFGVYKAIRMKKCWRRPPGAPHALSTCPRPGAHGP